jgi:hypothetical protein
MDYTPPSKVNPRILNAKLLALHKWILSDVRDCASAGLFPLFKAVGEHQSGTLFGH